jgi:hypothetical protein
MTDSDLTDLIVKFPELKEPMIKIILKNRQLRRTVDLLNQQLANQSDELDRLHALLAATR